MINHFRQLTLPCVVALSLMLLITGSWYHYESRLMLRFQAQQFTVNLQTSLPSLLVTTQPSELKAQLNHLRYVSVLPVTSIAVYTKTGDLVSGTENASLKLDSALTPIEQGFQIKKHQGNLVAVQPFHVSEKNMISDDLLVKQGEYYLVVHVTPKNNYLVWLVPVLVVALLGWASLLIIQNAFNRLVSRQQADISLLEHKLNQLKQGQLNTPIDDELFAGFGSLKDIINDLSVTQAQTKQLYKDELAQLKDRIALLKTTLDEKEAKLVEAQKQNQDAWYAQQQRLLQLKQLLTQQDLLSDIQFETALNNQLSLAKLQLESSGQVVGVIKLTSFVREHVSAWQKYLVDRGINFRLHEASSNALYQIQTKHELLEQFISALLQVGARSHDVTELLLSVEFILKHDKALLSLKVTGDGAGLAKHIQEQIQKQNHDYGFAWQDADSQLLTKLMAVFSASLEVKTLEGVGSTLSVTFSINEFRKIELDLLKHVLVFDTEIDRLQARKESLSQCAQSVSLCHDLDELKLKIQQHHYDCVVICLPAPSDLSLWQEMLRPLYEQTRVLCYCALADIAIWQKALGIAIEQSPFMLAHLDNLNRVNTVLPKLLVVDDNQTNLAFVGLLMKDKPLDISFAGLGEDAISLCKTKQFDVILLDIQLPDVHGTDVAKRIRLLPQYEHVPILAFTAHALDEEIASFKAAGMNDVILKPLELKNLSQILQYFPSLGSEVVG